jgi:hypothetical protein
MEQSLSTRNPREIHRCEAADCLESRMKESAGISARTVPEFAELKWLGRCTKNESLVFHQAVHRSHSFSSMYAPVVFLGFGCVAFVGKKRGDKFQYADA